jgi:hypothetical protein
MQNLLSDSAAREEAAAIKQFDDCRPKRRSDEFSSWLLNLRAWLQDLLLDVLVSFPFFVCAGSHGKVRTSLSQLDTSAKPNVTE